MKLSTFAATPAFTLLSTTSAMITGFSAPATIAANSVATFHIKTQDSQSTYQDVAFVFGYTKPATAVLHQSLGKLLAEKALGKGLSNVVKDITAEVKIPATLKGEVTLTGALFTLTGSLLELNTEFFAVNVTVGEKTLGEYVESERVFD